jgi:hypothetical protein
MKIKKPDEFKMVRAAECSRKDTIFAIADRIDTVLDGENIGDALSALGVVIAELMAEGFATDMPSVESFSELLRHNTGLMRDRPGGTTH